MSTGHTPGPWSVADLPHAIVVRTQSTKKTRYGADRYAAIGGFDRGDADQLAEALANACLIAAAPELLKALEIMVENFGPTPSEKITGLGEARAAIAKATGGAA